MNDMDLDIGQSSLFGDHQEPMDVTQSSLFEDMDSLPINTGPTSSAFKTARLANGTKVTLRQKTPKPAPDNNFESHGFIDMDKLYSELELNKAMKESGPKISMRSSPEVWASKYNPARFVDLCSGGNDKQYRRVMHWLRRWTPKGRQMEENEESSTFSQPRKILLLHGPPGVGKTASIHVIARQLGFHVEELNAANSLDGDSNGVRLRIINALTSNSIMSKGRPTCLVIDEVDCLANVGEVVRVLGSLHSKKSKVSINRPIICIANDIYAQTSRGFGPSPMERLRSMSDIVAYRRPRGNATRALKDHLLTIGKKENLDWDFQFITEVVELCDGDLRACLNHLQFARESGHKSTMDSQMSWFKMVDELFKRSPHMRRDEHFMKLMDTVGREASNNSFDKVIRGCFDRYLDVVKAQDDSLDKPAELSDWFAFYEKCSRDDSLQYSSCVGLKIWDLFSDIMGRKITTSLIPNARSLDFESRETRKQNAAIIKKITEGLPIRTKIAIGNREEAYSTCFLPYLSRMLDIELSSKVKSNLSGHEKKVVESLTTLVSNLHIRLENEKDMETGNITLQFAPNWDSISFFGDGSQKAVQAHRSTLFPLITTENERFTMAKATRHAVESVVKESSRKKQKVTSIDFFKGQYDGMGTQIAEPVQVQRIWVKYHEGYSAAVRKNITWADLWK